MNYLVILRKAGQADHETTATGENFIDLGTAKLKALSKLAELCNVSNHEGYVSVEVVGEDGQRYAQHLVL